MGAALSLPPLNVPALLREHNLRPQKRLGQNFLVEPVALERVCEAAELTSQDIVLEIGPGLGSLTRYLADRSKKVFAVELDVQLIPVLRKVTSAYSNIEIHHADILDVNPEGLVGQLEYKVVANIPYYITSAVLRHLLESGNPPQCMVLTVQKEVAQRICSGPGGMSLLALSVQVYGQPRIVATIPAGSFYPTPKVDSAVVRIDLDTKERVPINYRDDFFKLAKAGFGQKRKTLRNALASGLPLPLREVDLLLDSAEIEAMRRAETLNIDEWLRLAKKYANISRQKETGNRPPQT